MSTNNQQPTNMSTNSVWLLKFTQDQICASHFFMDMWMLINIYIQGFTRQLTRVL